MTLVNRFNRVRSIQRKRQYGAREMCLHKGLYMYMYILRDLIIRCVFVLACVCVFVCVCGCVCVCWWARSYVIISWPSPVRRNERPIGPLLLLIQLPTA